MYICMYNAPMCEFLGLTFIFTLKLPGNSSGIPCQITPYNPVHIFFFDRTIKYRCIT